MPFCPVVMNGGSLYAKAGEVPPPPPLAALLVFSEPGGGPQLSHSGQPRRSRSDRFFGNSGRHRRTTGADAPWDKHVPPPAADRRPPAAVGRAQRRGRRDNRRAGEACPVFLERISAGRSAVPRQLRAHFSGLGLQIPGPSEG